MARAPSASARRSCSSPRPRSAPAPSSPRCAGSWSEDSLLLTCACDLARDSDAASTEARWLHRPEEDEQAVDLLAALREARRPFDEELSARDARAPRGRSQARAVALRPRGAARPPSVLVAPRLGHRATWARPAAAALSDHPRNWTDPLEDAEREALATLGAMFVDPLDLQLDERGADAERAPRLRRACPSTTWPEQLDLARRTGRALRRGSGAAQGAQAARRRRAFSTATELSWGLADEGQARRRAPAPGRSACASDYLGWREQEARQLAKAQGIAGRLRNGPEDFLDEVDRRSLRFCPAARRSPTPTPKRASHERGAGHDVACRCHFCGPRSWRRSSRPATREATLIAVASGSARRPDGRSASRPFGGPASGSASAPPASSAEAASRKSGCTAPCGCSTATTSPAADLTPCARRGVIDVRAKPGKPRRPR